jgi:hypothetical protein
MPDATKVEFLRFGSSIPGAYWGCCACDIIQCFSGDPDAKASIQMVEGDGGSDLGVFAGPTNRDVFLQRLRVGTFGTYDMPNHTFLAILTDWQISSTNGKKWLKILSECGFEFVRAISNSVYDGQSLSKLSSGGGGHPQYLFMLSRNIGDGNVGNPYKPPKVWSDLKGSSPLYDLVGEKGTKELAIKTHAEQTAVYKKIGPAKFLTRAEVEKAGAPVILAAKRTTVPQQDAKYREMATKASQSAAKVTTNLFA